jgi:hypothetical protein
MLPDVRTACANGWMARNERRRTTIAGDEHRVPVTADDAYDDGSRWIAWVASIGSSSGDLSPARDDRALLATGAVEREREAIGEIGLGL